MKYVIGVCAVLIAVGFLIYFFVSQSSVNLLSVPIHFGGSDTTDFQSGANSGRIITEPREE